MLAFGGALAALTHARTTGVGQKIELSLLGSLVRLLGWTFTTTMWRNKHPVTGQARITGTRGAGGDQRLVQRSGWQAAGLPAHRSGGLEGGHGRAGLPRADGGGGLRDLGVIIDNDAKREELLALLDDLFATGPRDDWVARLRKADIVSAPINTLLEAVARSRRDRQRLRHRDVDYPKYGKKLKVHGTPGSSRGNRPSPASRRSSASTTESGVVRGWVYGGSRDQGPARAARSSEGGLKPDRGASKGGARSLLFFMSAGQDALA